MNFTYNYNLPYINLPTQNVHVRYTSIKMHSKEYIPEFNRILVGALYEVRQKIFYPNHSISDFEAVMINRSNLQLDDLPLIGIYS